MKAMILAAGEGTRLRPLTLTLPKPMVPIANIPLLVRTIRLLEAQGIHEIAVNLFHKREEIRRTLGDGESFGVRLHYSDEETLMGTAGGVKRMEAFLDEPFLVLYGDNLYRGDFGPLIDFHAQNDALVTIATFEAANPSACGLVITDENGRVTRFQEKPPPAEVFTNTANAGIYVCAPALLDSIAANEVLDFGKDIFPEILDTGRIFARPFGGYLQDTGTVPAYRQANWDALDGSDSAIAPDARIAESAVLKGRNVIGARVEVQSGAEITETIAWDDVWIGERAVVRDAILGRRVRIGDGARVESGAVVGDDTEIAPGAIFPRST